MRQFLKSGFIYQGNLFPTQTGSPQGGAISSIYVNMALDGLEKLIQDKYHRNSKGNIENHYRALHNRHRYLYSAIHNATVLLSPLSARGRPDQED